MATTTQTPMTDRPSTFLRFARELRRRRVFRVAGVYVVGAWLVMQAADVFFPGWGLPDSAINALLVAAVVGFPLALVFGWFYDLTGHGIVRTPPPALEGQAAPLPLRGTDYLILGALGLIASVIAYDAIREILESPSVTSTGAADGAHEVPVPDKLPDSIAVLPFANMSNDPDNEAFCDGVTEEILNQLGVNRGLHVIARTSSFQFKGSDYGIPRIAALLGVTNVLQGSVRRQGDRIRVSAQLVDDKGTQLWSQNYDRTLEDIFAIQDEIAGLVALVVAPRIVARQASGYRPSLAAYEHFLAGRELLHRRDWLAAREELEVAIEMDPDYAEAQAEYAISLVMGFPDEQAFRKADAAIDAALRRAPDLPRALAARGLFLAQRSPPDPVAVEAVLREALRRDPHMVDAMNWLSQALTQQGRDDEGDEWLDKAYALDPFNAAIAVNTATRYWEEGNPDRAEAMLRRLTELPKPPLPAFFSLSDLYGATGRLVEAHRVAKRLLLSGGWQNYLLAHNYAMLGQFQTAAHWMAGTARDHPETMWVRTGWVQAHAPHWEGDYGQAVGEMNQAWAAHDLSIQQIPPAIRRFYGINQALAESSAGAIDTLAEVLPSGGDRDILGGAYGVDAYQSLAWSYLQSGQPGEARQVLDAVERWFAGAHGSAEMVKSTSLYEAARNAVLMGDDELALDRLEQAVTAGWREFYIKNRDPRWAALRDDPRYQALMAEVKADVDRQWKEVERMDAEEDFPALLEQVREREAVTSGLEGADQDRTIAGKVSIRPPAVNGP